MSEELKVKRKIRTTLYLAALVITISIFAVGIIVGFQINNTLEGQFTNELQQIQTASVNSELLALLATNNTQVKQNVCESLLKNYPQIASQTSDLGEKLSLLEEKQGKQNQDVIFLKKQYFALEARDFLLFKRLREECNANYTLVLYFYGDETCTSGIPCRQAIQNAELQLTQLKNANPSKILIYSFDADYAQSSPSVAALKSAYAPAIPIVVQVQ